MLKYIGKAYIAGIPARDLNDEEVNRFGKERLLKSGLYEEEKKTETKKSKRYETAEAVMEETNGTGY